MAHGLRKIISLDEIYSKTELENMSPAQLSLARKRFEEIKELSPDELNDLNDSRVLELIARGKNLKVYFLGYSMNYDGCNHHGVFFTKENAEKYKNFLIEDGKEENESLGWHYYITEYEVDAPLQDSLGSQTK